jgi:phage gp36-like protein
MAASYATTADLVKYGLLAEAFTGVTVVEQDALDAASALAESHVKKRYTAPLTAWGLDLRRAVCHIASYDLLCQRGFNPQRGADQVILKRHDDAMNWLRDVARGIVELADAASDSTPELDEASPIAGSAREALWDVEGTGSGDAPGDPLFDNDP